MLLPQERLEAVREAGHTIVELLIGVVLSETPARWQDFVVDGASDVDDARTISLLPSDTHLTLFEREVSKRDHEVKLRRSIRGWLDEAKRAYDIVMIDSAPGLSVLTECWLREADFYLSPTKPDYTSRPRCCRRPAKLATSKGFANMETAHADAEALPFEDARFDLVTCRIAAHHFPDVPTFVAEVWRVLKGGGNVRAGRQHLAGREVDAGLCRAPSCAMRR